MSNKKLTASQLREFRSQVAKLKKHGLVSAKKDARSQKPTRYMLGQVKKFEPVLKGHAQTVQVSYKDAKAYGELYARKGRTVVIPTFEKGGSKPRYNKKTGEITSTTYKNGEKIVREYPKRANANGIAELPKGDNIYYTIPFQGRGSYRTNDLSEVYNMMRDLVSSGWTNVQQYIIVERVSPDGRVKITGL